MVCPRAQTNRNGIYRHFTWVQGKKQVLLRHSAAASERCGAGAVASSLTLHQLAQDIGEGDDAAGRKVIVADVHAVQSVVHQLVQHL